MRKESKTTKKSSTTRKSSARGRGKHSTLLSSLPERFTTAYDNIDNAGLSKAEAEALKARIVDAAKKRKEKGSLYFTSTMSKEQFFTFDGVCKLIDELLVYKMNDKEIALAREVSTKVGVNILQGKSSIKDEINKDISEIDIKGAFAYLMEAEGAPFYPYVALAKKFGTFDPEQLSVYCREEKELEDKELHDYSQQVNLLVLAKIWLSMFLPCYNFLAERNFAQLTDAEKIAARSGIKIAWENRATGITVTKLAKLLNVPLKLMNTICSKSEDSEAVKKSSRLANDMFQMLVNRDKSQQGQDSLKDRLTAAQEDEEFCSIIKKSANNAKANGKKGGPATLASLNSRDLLALSPLAQTVFTAFLEDIGRAGTNFNGELKFSSLTSLAQRCGVDKPNRNYNTRLANAINELWKASLEYTVKENQKQYLVKTRILSTIKKESGERGQAFTITISETFRERFFQLMNEKGNFFYSNGRIANVTQFYLQGKCNEYRPKNKQTSTVKKEIPPYTLALLAVLERQKDTSNGDIGKNKLLRRVGLYSYIEQRKPKEAEWRLREAIEAALAGGYIKSYSTKSSSTEGEDIVYNFNF